MKVITATIVFTEEDFESFKLCNSGGLGGKWRGGYNLEARQNDFYNLKTHLLKMYAKPIGFHLQQYIAPDYSFTTGISTEIILYAFEFFGEQFHCPSDQKKSDSGTTGNFEFYKRYCAKTIAGVKQLDKSMDNIGHWEKLKAKFGGLSCHTPLSEMFEKFCD